MERVLLRARSSGQARRRRERIADRHRCPRSNIIISIIIISSSSSSSSSSSNSNSSSNSIIIINSMGISGSRVSSISSNDQNLLRFLWTPERELCRVHQYELLVLLEGRVSKLVCPREVEKALVKGYREESSIDENTFLHVFTTRRTSSRRNYQS